MQNREEFRQKGHDGSRKTTCRERGKNIIFRRGGGINIVFGPKYRPLYKRKMEIMNPGAGEGCLDVTSTHGSTTYNSDPNVRTSEFNDPKTF